MSSPSPENIASPAPTPVILSTADVPATLVKSPTILGVSEIIIPMKLSSCLNEMD